MLSPLDPVSVSAKLEPKRFSMEESVSVPSPPVFCAPAVTSETVTPALRRYRRRCRCRRRRASVSLLPPPRSVSLPLSPESVSWPE